MRICLLGAAGLAAWGSPAFAHSRGSAARLDAATRIRIQEERILVEHSLTLSRAGAYLEVIEMDTNGDGVLAEEEQDRYFDKVSRIVAAGLEVKLNGREIHLTPAGKVELEMPFTKRYTFSIDQPADWRKGTLLEFHNDTFLEFPGRTTIDVDPGTGADIVFCSLQRPPEEERSEEGGTLYATDPEERDLVMQYREGTGLQCAATHGDHPALPGAATPLSGEEGYRPTGRSVAIAGCLAAWTALVLLIAAGRRGEPLSGRLPAARLSVPLLAVCLLGTAFVAVPGQAGRSGRPDDLEAARIFQALHRDIYEAFNADTESRVYDALSECLDGGLLHDVYLQVRRTLVTREDGDVTCRIRRVKPLSCRVLPPDRRDGRGYRVHYRWRVYGTVSHFRHRHARINDYEATYAVDFNNGAWRITDARIEDQRRFEPGAY
jgi:hypothetical protein